MYRQQLYPNQQRTDRLLTIILAKTWSLYTQQAMQVGLLGKGCQGGKVAQGVKRLAAKPDNLFDP